MNHSRTLIVALMLLASMAIGTNAQAQTATTMEPLTEWPQELGAGPIKSVGQWFARGWARRAQRRGQQPFRIQVGRSITITVSKN